MKKGAAKNENSRDLFVWENLTRLEAELKIAREKRDKAFWAKICAPVGKIKLRQSELNKATFELLRAELEFEAIKFSG